MTYLKYEVIGILCFAAIAAAMTPGQTGQCPENICSTILLSDACRSTTSYVLYKDQMCRQCDTCIDRDTPTDTRGCPILKCQTLTYRPGCTSKQYFLWNNQLCPDCDVDTC